MDAVIGLPPNIFYGTAIPTCIMVYKKCRENPEDILFIDASKDYEKGTQNHIRKEDITKIITTYQNRTPKEKYSYVASLNEIKENEYNLNIPKYVDTFKEDKPIDIDIVSQNVVNLNKDIQNTEKEIAKFCKELKISTPF